MKRKNRRLILSTIDIEIQYSRKKSFDVQR